MDLQELFRRSFAIWWRVRALWAAGVIAALVGYGEYGASANFQWSNSAPVTFDPGDPPPFDQLRELEPQLAWLLDNVVGVIVCVVVGSLIWAIVAGLIGALANGAMIQIADSAYRDQPASFGAGMRAGSARMVPLFLIGLILVLPLLLILAVIFGLLGSLAWQLFSRGADDPSLILPQLFGVLACAFPLGILAAILSALLHLLGRLAARACVLEGLGALASIGRGWGLFRSRLGQTLLLWLVMAIAGIVVSALMSLPALALIIPVGLGLAGGGGSGLIVVGIVGLLIYALVVNVAVGGVLTSFNATIWTLHYHRLVGGGTVGAPRGYM